MKGLLSLGFLSLVTRATMQRAQTFQSIDINDKIYQNSVIPIHNILRNKSVTLEFSKYHYHVTTHCVVDSYLTLYCTATLNVHINLEVIGVNNCW